MSILNLSELQQTLHEFAQERDWQRVHSPKNLAMAASVEASELLEIFQWLTEEESKAASADPILKEKIEHEIADVLLYVIRLAGVLNIDISQAIQQKIILNCKKYPVNAKA